MGGLDAYGERMIGITLRHRDWTLALHTKYRGRALTTALRLNQMAIDEGWRTIYDKLQTYWRAHYAIHGSGR